MRGDVQGDIGRVDQISKIPDEQTGSHPLKHSGGVERTDISKDIRKRNIPESLEGYTDPTPVQGTGDEEPRGYSTHSDSPNEWGEPLITDGTEDYCGRGGFRGTLVPHGMDERCRSGAHDRYRLSSDNISYVGF